MPAKPPTINPIATQKLIVMGVWIRNHRKQMGITATAVAEAAGMSRVTLHRIENGEPAVTIGAYINAMQVLGLEIAIESTVAEMKSEPDGVRTGWIPVRIHLQDYPELKRLAWHIQGIDELTPAEALGIYERNWRHLDSALLSPAEQDLIDGLRLVFVKDSKHV